MSTLEPDARLNEENLTAALDELSPVPACDLEALGRVHHRLTVAMQASRPATVIAPARSGDRVELPGGRRRPIGRRAAAGLAVAAVGAGVFLGSGLLRDSHGGAGSPAAMGVSSDRSSGVPSSAGRADAASPTAGIQPGSASQVLLEAAVVTQSAPTLSGPYVKITERSTESDPRDGHGQAGSTPTVLPETVVTYRPADLRDTSTPWVRSRGAADGTPGTDAERCGNFVVTTPPTPACGAGSWADVTPIFVADLAGRSAAQNAAALQAYAATRPLAGVSAAATAIDLAESAFVLAEGDDQASSALLQMLSVVARENPSITATRLGVDYAVAVADGATEYRLTFDARTGAYTGWSTQAGPGQATDVPTGSGTVTVAAASELPPVTPAQTGSTAPGSPASK